MATVAGIGAVVAIQSTGGQAAGGAQIRLMGPEILPFNTPVFDASSGRDLCESRYNRMIPAALNTPAAGPVCTAAMLALNRKE